MPDDVGHFKVILEAEVGRDVGKTLEKGFEKSSEKIGKKLQEEIEESIDKSIEKARKFEKSFKIPSFGQIGEKLTGFLGDTTKKVTAGGLAAGAGDGSGILAIVGKLSIVVGILALVYDVIKSLAPMVAIFKLISATLQLTLYPIAQFLLAIFKPILAIILKMFIIPWYTTWGPALLTLLPKNPIERGKDIITDPIGTFEEDIKNTWKFLEGFGKWYEEQLMKIYNTAKDIWSSLGTSWDALWLDAVNLVKNYEAVLVGIYNWLKNSWSGITNAILSPLQSVWSFINSIRLPSWLGGGGGGGKVPSLPTGGGYGYNPSTGIYTPGTGPGYEPIKGPGPHKLAEGGIVRSPTVSLIGESGPEAVIPLNKLGSMGNINLTINIAKVEKSVDINTLITQIERILYTNMKRAGAR